MTYYVLSGTLNPTHSLITTYYYITITVISAVVHMPAYMQQNGEDTMLLNTFVGGLSAVKTQACSV